MVAVLVPPMTPVNVLCISREETVIDVVTSTVVRKIVLGILVVVVVSVIVVLVIPDSVVVEVMVRLKNRVSSTVNVMKLETVTIDAAV